MKFKNIFLYLLFSLYSLTVVAQDKDVKLPPNWYNLDLKQDGYFGVSTERAYKELLSKKQPKQKVVVAVIDSGTDIKHEDLKDVLWVNKKEIPGNGIDDDKNGYVDDIHGWNFLGSSKGNLTHDNLEMVRIIRAYRDKYISTLPSTKLDSAEKLEYALYLKANEAFGKEYDDASSTMQFLDYIKEFLNQIALKNNKSEASYSDIEKYKAETDLESQLLNIIKKESKNEAGFEKFAKEMKKGYTQYKDMLTYNLNPTFDERQKWVGDNYEDSSERFYGNNDVTGPDAEHGTHVSGIIGANRKNKIGINGIADHVEIMTIRAVPNGDERDKDVANAIRYAVDNGAKIINMSFGKDFKWDKKVVDEAVKYAEQKHVLLVHAAGNDNVNTDFADNFPNKYYETPESKAYHNKLLLKKLDRVATPPSLNNIPAQVNKSKTEEGNKGPDLTRFSFPSASNWIEVGASAYKLGPDLKANFSNYGKNMVDIFAPGFMINSTTPGSNYEEFDGTSMAAPVVSGVAAVLLTYHPELKPKDIRDILMKSSIKVEEKVKHVNEKGESLRVNFNELSVSGGIVNLYEALKMAESYKSKN